MFTVCHKEEAELLPPQLLPRCLVYDTILIWFLILFPVLSLIAAASSFVGLLRGPPFFCAILLMFDFLLSSSRHIKNYVPATLKKQHTHHPPPPKNVERNILGYVDRLKFCSLFLLIAQFNNNKRPPHNASTTHNMNDYLGSFHF